MTFCEPSPGQGYEPPAGAGAAPSRPKAAAKPAGVLTDAV